MTTIRFAAALAAATLAACATTGAGPSKVLQADHVRPELKDMSDEAEWSALKDAAARAARADAARSAGNQEEARAEDVAAGRAFAAFADRFPRSEWRLVVRRMAVERLLQAQEPNAAAAQAQKLLDDPAASDVTRAMAARYAAVAWQAVAASETRAGRVEKLRLLTAAQRGGQPPKPRIPDEPWKRFIESTDAYLKLAASDPALKPGPERDRAGAVQPAQLARIAAEVEFAYDNMEDARSRLDRIIARHPSDAEVMDSAVPLYLETFLVLGDDAGYEAALRRLEPVTRAEAEKAAAAARAPNATGEQKKAAETLARLEDSVAKQLQVSGFSAAARLLAAGQAAEAAQGFETFADQNKGHPDAPNALYNAAVAWDKAKDPAKAKADRERLVREYPDAKVASQGMLALAATLSRGGDHAGAQQLYAQYLERFPEGPQRCIALQNVGYELDQMKRREEAARRYQAFAVDSACTKGDPNTAAKALYRSGILFLEAKKRKEAKEAWTTLMGVQGVTDEVTLSWIDDARARLKGLR